jgi:hypothetical protein
MSNVQYYTILVKQFNAIGVLGISFNSKYTIRLNSQHNIFDYLKYNHLMTSDCKQGFTFTTHKLISYPQRKSRVRHSKHPIYTTLQKLGFDFIPSSNEKD